MPPPPPPPGPPPPPTFNPANFKASSSSAPDPKGRNMLLESIRQGKPLKKTTVVNDRSAPIVDSKPKASNGGPSGNNATVGNRGNGLNIPPGLGGLFAGGMPKLKPAGSPGPRVNTNSSNNNEQSSIPRNASSNSLNSNNSSVSASSSVPVSPFNSPSATTKQPPQPPPSSLKPTSSNQDERKSGSNFGKPSLAPKPPSLNGAKPARPNPPPKLPNLYIPNPPPAPDLGNSSQTSTPQSSTPTTPGSGVYRAQSMRAPKSTSPTSSTAATPEYRTMGRTAGRAFVTNAGGQPPPPPRLIANGGQRPRPTAIRPPAARPPPPPNKTPPVHPPPPPPATVPPPPPHRTGPAPAPPQVRMNGLIRPQVPHNINGQNLTPPPPPTRNSSMRSITSTVSATSIGSSSGSSNSSTYSGVDLEAKFGHLFHDLNELPRPDPYTGIVKYYPSKNAQSVKRQPAPQPPTQTQLQLGNKLWVDNTSSC